MSPTADQLVERYLKRLNEELDGLPGAQRREVVQEISEHIAEARSELESQNEAAIRTLLDRLGEPADIAAEARARFGIQERRAGWLEISALVLLLVGGFIAVVGWFVGVVLLWASDVWTRRDKLIGTLVVPGGLVLPLTLLVFAGSSGGCSQRIDPVTHKVLSESCTGGTSDLAQALWILLFVVLLTAPLATSVYLARRMRKRSVAAAV